jgi:hypothetical protein
MRLTWISCVPKLGMLAVSLNGQTQRDVASSVYNASADISHSCASFCLQLAEVSFYAIIREGHIIFPLTLSSQGKDS